MKSTQVMPLGSISKDIIQRWTYPYVSDLKFCGNRAAKLERQGILMHCCLMVAQNYWTGNCLSKLSSKLLPNGNLLS